MSVLPGAGRLFGSLFWILAVAAVGVVVALAKGHVREASAITTGICGRTSEVSTAVVAASGAPGCAQVTMHHLREVTHLDLSDQGISSLDSGDFAGLVRLDVLDLSDNALTALPAGVFDELLLLRDLRLDGNSLSTVPSGVFDQLFMLEELSLSGNASLALPAGLFDEFSRFAGMGTDGTLPAVEGNYPLIEGFIERNSVTTVEEFIEALPDLYKERFVMNYQSEAAARDHVSYEHPRIATFGGDGRFTFAWNTDPDAPAPFQESVEFLRQNESDWSAGVIDFSGDEPSITEPAACQTCHGTLNKPIWGLFEEWLGTEYALTGVNMWNSEAIAAATRAASYSTDPRIEPLSFYGSSFTPEYTGRFLKTQDQSYYKTAVAEAGAVWSWRHAEVLLSNLIARKSDFRAFSEDLMCRTAVEQGYLLAVEFHPAEHHLFVPANIGEERLEERERPGGEVATILTGRMPDVQRAAYWYTYGGTVADAVTLLVLAGLWQQEPIVRKLYRDTINTDTLSESQRHRADYLLYYDTGAANAEDELIQKLRMHFGRGIQASLNARDAHNGKRYRGGDIASAFKDGHLRGMTPRVCSALGDSKPSNLSVDTDGDDPVLSWDAPDYTEAPTGYRILRGAAGQEPTVLEANTGTTSTTWSDEDPTSGDIVYTVQAMYDGYPRPDSNAATATVAGSSTSTTTTTTSTTTTTTTVPPTTTTTTTTTVPPTTTTTVPPTTTTTVPPTTTTTVPPTTTTTVPEEQPLTAQIHAAPQSDHGGNPFTFELRFNQELPLSYATLRDTAFSVTGGEVVKARRLATSSNLRWEITVSPSSKWAVAVVLPVPGDCTVEGALCTADHRPLSNRLELTVPGPRLTAEIRDLQFNSDRTQVSFELRFSEEFALSYVTLRDDAFTVSGGEVVGTRRLDKPSNLRWQITVTRRPGQDLLVVLPVPEDCDDEGAICADDRRPLHNRLEVRTSAPGS